MDNITHSLFGALLGQTGLKRKTGLGMAALVIGANIPDIDGACTIYGLESLSMRRGLTHGPIAWLLLPLVLAALLYGWDRWQTSRGKRPEGRLPVRFGWLYLLALIGCLTHPLLDWMNSYGIRFLEPFSDRWFYGDALFIIDIWLWAALGFSFWYTRRKEKRGEDWKTPARVALLGVVAYMGFNVTLAKSFQAVVHEPGRLITNPVPFAFWKREALWEPEPGIWFVDGKRFGDAKITNCDFDEARKADKTLDAFLFWSRAPFVESVGADGWILGDARFASTDRFKVRLPDGTCHL